MKLKWLCLTAVFLTLGGCAVHHGPVLYPNDHLRAVGEAQAKMDIDECGQMADAYVRTNPSGDMAKSTAAGGAGGSVIGGAAGAVTGNFGTGIGVGAAAGAAAGPVAGSCQSVPA